MADSALDPFYVVKDELSSKIENATSKLKLFQTLLDSTDTATSPEFKDCRKSLARELKSCDKQLKDLAQTVDLVQKDRLQFAHIDDYELEQRKTYVKTVRHKLDEMKGTYGSDKVKAKMLADERKAIASRPASSLGATSGAQMENTNYIHDQQAQARMIINQQDEDLEELGQAVDRVGDMATNINQELKTQNKMLKELDDDIEAAAEKMNFVMGKLAKLLKTKDTCQIMTVIILTLVLVLLIFLLIYT